MINTKVAILHYRVHFSQVSETKFLEAAVFKHAVKVITFYLKTHDWFLKVLRFIYLEVDQIKFIQNRACSNITKFPLLGKGWR